MNAIGYIGYWRFKSTIFTELVLGQVKNDVTGVKSQNSGT